MNPLDNPFVADPDRYAIWDMLMTRDVQAFVAGDWSMVEDDFDAQRFLGVHAHNSANPDDWTAEFHELDVYREEWLRQAAASAATEYAEPLFEAIMRSVDMNQIDIVGDVAVVHKKFDGRIRRADGGEDRLNWQTVYYCRRAEERWRITGFVGYMKYR